MVEIIFLFNNKKTIIKCEKDELMINICKKYSKEINEDINTMSFTYEEKQINFYLALKEIINENNEIKKKDIIIKTCKDKSEKGNNNYISTKINNIVCPKCGEVCLINIIDYKITFYQCKNGHILRQIPFDEYNLTQKFHELNNNIIQSNNICEIHNQIYNSYCEMSNKNFCKICQKEQKEKLDLIYFKDISPSKKDINNQLIELKNKINDFNNKIKEYIKILNKVCQNMESYYKLSYDILNSYKEENKNYFLIKNIKEVSNNNKLILNDLNNIKNNDNINFFNNILNLYSKMTSEYIDNLRDKENKEEKINEIIAIYDVRNNVEKIRILGSEFTKINKNNFDLFIKEKKYNLKDTLNSTFWNNSDETIEIKFKGKNICSNMKNMFESCSSLISISNESKWNTDYVTDMSFMFYGCSKLKELPNISTWNTINVRDMSHMFRECTSIRYMAYIDNFKVDNVTDLSFMFYGCSSLIRLPDISKWNTSKVKDMSYLFFECSLLTNIPDISNWDTINVYDI